MLNNPHLCADSVCMYIVYGHLLPALQATQNLSPALQVRAQLPAVRGVHFTVVLALPVVTTKGVDA